MFVHYLFAYGRRESRGWMGARLDYLQTFRSRLFFETFALKVGRVSLSSSGYKKKFSTPVERLIAVNTLVPVDDKALLVLQDHVSVYVLALPLPLSSLSGGREFRSIIVS